MKAQDAARQMRYVDVRSQLIACGSSGPGHADVSRVGSRGA